MKLLVRGMWTFIALAWLSPVIIVMLPVPWLALVHLFRMFPSSIGDLAAELLLNSEMFYGSCVIVALTGIFGIIIAPAWAGIRFTWEGMGFRDGTWPFKQLGFAGIALLSTLSWGGLSGLCIVAVLVIVMAYNPDPSLRVLELGVDVVLNLSLFLSWPCLSYWRFFPSPESPVEIGLIMTLAVFMDFVLLANTFAISGALARRAWAVRRGAQ